MTHGIIEDSPYRCPHCSKRMMRDIGPDESGRLEVVDHCWNCGYERRGEPDRTTVRDVSRPSVLAESLRRMRLELPRGA